MDFLGIGPLEILVVLIIALIVVGPERLPEIAQTIGKTLRDLRAMSQGLTTEWQQELSNISGELTNVSPIEIGEKGLQQSLTEPLKEAQADIQRALTTPLTSPSDATAEPLKEAQADIQRALTAPLTSPSDATAEPSPPQTPSSTPNTEDDQANHANQ
jgi:sec-independent protein translocase protein TatB